MRAKTSNTSSLRASDGHCVLEFAQASAHTPRVGVLLLHASASAATSASSHQTLFRTVIRVRHAENLFLTASSPLRLLQQLTTSSFCRFLVRQTLCTPNRLFQVFSCSYQRVSTDEHVFRCKPLLHARHPPVLRIVTLCQDFYEHVHSLFKLHTRRVAAVPTCERISSP